MAEITPRRRIALILIVVTLPLWLAVGVAGYSLRATYACLLLPDPDRDLANCQTALEHPLTRGDLRKFVVVKLAQAQIKVGENDAAQALLQDALQTDPANHLARNTLADLEYANADYDAAADHYLVLSKAYPDNRFHLGNLLSSLNYALRWDEALALAQPFAEKHNDAWSWEWLAWTEQQAGKFASAATSYEKAFAHDPSRVELLTLHGFNLELAGNTTAAMKAYDSAIGLQESADNIAYRIALNTKLNNKFAVHQDYELTLRIDDTAKNKADYARFLLDEDEYERADKLLASAVASEPGHFATLEQSIRAKVLLRDVEGARKAIEAFKSTGPSESDIIYWQAALEDASGNHLGAIKGYKKAFENWEHWSFVRTDIGNCLLDLNLPQASLSWFDGAISVDPQHPAALIGRARAYLNLKMPERALADADAALGLDPSHGVAHARRAEALIALGRSKDAGVAYSSAIAFRPRLTWIREDYAKLLDAAGETDKAKSMREGVASP